jgi:hypothetical protein
MGWMNIKPERNIMLTEPTLFDSKDTQILHQIVNEIELQIATSKRMATTSRDPVMTEKHVGIGAYLVKLLDFITKLQQQQPQLKA